jgi:perosamine synthetase
VQCAVGLTQLRKVDRIIKVRQERMLQLNELLAGVEEIILPIGHGPEHGSHLHVIRVNTDKVGFSTPQFVNHLKKMYKVSTAKHYPAVWEWEAFQGLGYSGDGCPIAAKACSQVVTTPIFPTTTAVDVEYIAWAIKQTITDLKNG